MRCLNHYIQNMLVPLMAVCLAWACTDDGWMDGGRIPEGEETTVTLNFDVLSPRERSSRAAQAVEYEYRVTNLYVMEFDASGKRVDKADDRGTGNFFSIEKGNIQNAHNKQSDTDVTSSGTISFQGVTGSSMTIIGVANVGTSSSSLTIDQLNAVQTLSDLKGLTMSNKDGANIFRGASFLMTGYAVSGGKRTINIAYGAQLDAKILLERVDSKITFHVTAKSTKYSDMKFVPKQWQVLCVPYNSKVMENESVGVEDVITESRDADGNLFGSDWTKFEETADNSGSFTFYMYENLKKPKRLIRDEAAPSDLADRTDQNWRYAYRELRNKQSVGTSESVINKDFKYASDAATYVKLSGELSYKDGDRYVLADVEYTIHLGYAKQAGAQADDYRTERNSHYTYNVTITGVNSLIAEVEQNREERPGAEGDVVISGDAVKTFDSHYSRTKFALTSAQVSNLIFAVKTPFENGIQTADNALQVKDYKWVKFLINAEAGVSTSRLAAYPGEQCYDGGQSATGTSAYSGAYRKYVTLRDAKQLVTFLKDNATYKNGVTITAFIDEYLYTYNPLTDNYKAPNASSPNLTLWKNGIGHGNRMLHLVPGGEIKTSADGNTTVAHSAMTFVQRPIETIYDVNNENLKTAWGTEMVNETGMIQCNYDISGLPTTATSPSDGLSNTRKIATNKTLKWADLLSATDENAMNSAYKNPLYTWALRNRDFDGDGTVDADEVVWYLASVNEMQDLWIGENALSEPLFDEANCDKMSRTLNHYTGTYSLQHYLTSTYKSKRDNKGDSSGPMVYWAEEYGATSTHKDASDWTGFGTNSESKSPRHCRYLRHLGVTNSSTAAPQTYYTITSSGTMPNLNAKKSTTTNIYTIALTYLNTNAIRKSFDNGTELPYSNLGEAGENNLPSMKFQVAASSGITSSTNKWSDYYAGKVSYANGYRMPNQREMVLMSNYLDGWTQQKFTMRNAQKVYYTNTSGNGYFYGAFEYDSSVDYINRGANFGNKQTDISNKFYVRPVKDVK